jgi:hypothetical protein
MIFFSDIRVNNLLYKNMEILKEVVNEWLAPMKDLLTFEGFRDQTVKLIYDDIRERSKNKEEFIGEAINRKYFCGTSNLDSLDEAIKYIQEHLSEKPLIPKYELKVKPLKTVYNPITGRKLQWKGAKCLELIEQGILDEHGEPTEAYRNNKVKKIISPQTRKPVTVGLKAHAKLIEDGWITADNKILKVQHPLVDEIVSVKSKEFQQLVEEGLFETDGTPITGPKKKS